MSLSPNPMSDFNVPGAYTDPEGQRLAKGRLRTDAFAAYSLALASQLVADADARMRYAAKATEFLDAWASVTTRVSGADGDLVMMYAGVPLLYAADLLLHADVWPEERRSRFTYWSSTVFWNSAHAIKDRANNWGAWGTLGAVASAALVGNAATLADETGRLAKRIEEQIDANGELPEENKRTNSGMWYTYFALTAMTAAAHIIKNVTGADLFSYVAPNGRSLRLALDRHFFYAEHPEAWPYILPDGIEGEIWRALYPCADEVELPTVTGWPGPLFEIMSDLYGVAAWREWVMEAVPLTGYHGFIFVTLMRQNP